MRSTPALPLLHALCAAVTLALEPGAAATAGGSAANVKSIIHVVTSCADSGQGSLREAVGMAVFGDTIDLSQLPCSDSTITLTTGAVAVPIDGLVISGIPLARATDGASGAPFVRPIIDGHGQDRVFDHAGTGGLEVFYLTLRNGVADGSGGCLHSTGSVTLVGSVISGCTSNSTGFSIGGGGGLSVDRLLYLKDSRVTGNTANGYSFANGGGVFVNGPLTMIRSTIADNTATGAFGFGGGLYASNAVAISYSTISGNHATGIGGAELFGADGTVNLSIVNTTISGNTGGTIGGLLALASPLHIASSTIAFNTSTAATGIGGLGVGNPSMLQSTLIAHNIAGDAGSDLRGQCGIGTCAPEITGANNLVMVSALPLPADTLADDPLLAALANNGGSTQTHAIAANSPAIDHGNAMGTGVDCVRYDQRGTDYGRPVGAAPDIGAFERGSGTDSIFIDGFDGPTEGKPVGGRPMACP